MNPLPADFRLNLLIWTITLAVLVAWQVRTTRDEDLPSLGDLAGVARRRLLTRWAMLVGWAWLGWHLFVRTEY